MQIANNLKFIHLVYAKTSNTTKNFQSYDYAIVKLPVAFTLNHYVNPICLPETFPVFNHDQWFWEDKDLTIAGWGDRLDGLSDKLLYGYVKKVSRDKCDLNPPTVSQQKNFYLNNSICVAGAGEACYRDEGGPLSWDNGYDGGRAYLG